MQLNQIRLTKHRVIKFGTENLHVYLRRGGDGIVWALRIRLFTSVMIPTDEVKYVNYCKLCRTMQKLPCICISINRNRASRWWTEALKEWYENFGRSFGRIYLTIKVIKLPFQGLFKIRGEMMVDDKQK